MSKVTKFVYVPLSENLRFQHMLRENDEAIVPCNVYINREDQKIYFVEQPTGAVVDLVMNLYDTDTYLEL